MSALINSFKSRYSKQGLWSLFLICAFPLHFWTMILVFRDVSWVMERTNIWDAIGVGSYGMVFAFAESVVLFVVFALLGIFLTPRQWDVGKRIALLSLLVIILSAWGMISQLFFLWNIFLPASIIQFLVQSGRPLLGLYAITLVIVIPTVVLPVYQFMRADGMHKSIEEFGDRLSLLTIVYLFLDLAGLVIVVLRNLP